jgi:hypothetical protein
MFENVNQAEQISSLVSGLSTVPISSTANFAPDSFKLAVFERFVPKKVDCPEAYVFF